jgi:hypothetical protein
MRAVHFVRSCAAVASPIDVSVSDILTGLLKARLCQKLILGNASRLLTRRGDSLEDIHLSDICCCLERENLGIIYSTPNTLEEFFQ